MPKSRRTSISLEQLFAFCIETSNGCLEWQRYKDKNGYGRFRINGVKARVTRLVCSIVYGEPSENALALHSCDNPPCINPDHLRWGTSKENTADMRGRNRQGAHYGVLTGSAKLTDEIVLEIRARKPKRGEFSSFAREYGMSVQAMCDVINKKTWKHL